MENKDKIETMKHEEQHIQEMIAIFKDDFDMHNEHEVHLCPHDYELARMQYVMQRMADNWAIDREYSKQLELKSK